MAEAWSEYRIGEALERAKRPIAVVADGRYFQIGIRSFGKGFFHKPQATAADIGNKRLFGIEPGDLVFNIVFAWEGAVALAGPTEEGTCGSHRFPTYRPCNDIWLSRFAELFFQSPSGIALLREASPGSAGRNKTLSQGRLLDFAIAIPPLEDQQDVVDLVDAMDAAVTANERYAQKLAAVLGELREEMVERQSFEIAEFRRGLTNIEGGRSPKAEDREPDGGERCVLKVSAVKPGFFDRTEVKTLTADTAMPDRAALRDDDLLITRANTAALVGAVCLVERAPAGFFLCDKTLRLTTNSALLSKRFAVHALATKRVRAHLERVATGSSASMKNISQEKIKAVPVAFPPLSEQDRIADALDKASLALHLLKRKNAALAALRAQAVPALLARRRPPEQGSLSLAA